MTPPPEPSRPEKNPISVLNTHRPTAAAQILLGRIIARFDPIVDDPEKVKAACDLACPRSWNGAHRRLWKATRNRLMIGAGWPAVLVKGGNLADIADARIHWFVARRDSGRVRELIASDPLVLAMPLEWGLDTRRTNIWLEAIARYLRSKH